MSHVMNRGPLAGQIISQLKHDVLTGHKIGPLWCGSSTETALRVLAAQDYVRSWTVVADDHEHWHAYVTTHGGMTYHGRTVDHDSALRVALGELLLTIP